MSFNFYWWHIFGLGVNGTTWSECDDDNYTNYRTMMVVNLYLMLVVVKITFPISGWKKNPNSP